MPSQSSLKERIVSASGHVLARLAGEDLGDEERLREEALDAARAVDEQLVVLAQLLDTQDGDDVLQLLVALQDPHDLARDVVVLLADVSAGRGCGSCDASGSTAG